MGTHFLSICCLSISNLAITLAAGVQTQYFLYLSHGQPLAWHPALLNLRRANIPWLSRVSYRYHHSRSGVAGFTGMGGRFAPEYSGITGVFLVIECFWCLGYG